jgi:hypothetical protein
MSNTIHVINIRKKNLQKIGFEDFMDWKQYDIHVYIGRNVNMYVPGALRSKWANPFSLSKYSLEESLQLYKDYVRNGKLYGELKELKGKILGCWCKPDRCHGDILKELMKEQEDSEVNEEKE